MRLLVVRHAIAMDRVDYQLSSRKLSRHPASDTGSDQSDDLRPLTPEGIRKMRKNARGLKAIVDRPMLLITSPLTRALQTTEILEDVWKGVDVQVCEHLRPGSDPKSLCAWLRKHVKTESEDTLAVVVGHEPHLSGLVNWFLTGEMQTTIDLKKGGACLLSFEPQIEKAHGVLSWLATPKLLRSLAKA